MSTTLDNSGIPRNNTGYVMLNNYCGKPPVPLGVQNVAPTFAPYGANPMYQDIPVFQGVNYNQAPYENPIMFRCGDCGGSYCNALKGYGWPTDKDGNPLPDAVFDKDGRRVSGYQSVSYVTRTPTERINQTCAIPGNCSAGMMPSVVRK